MSVPILPTISTACIVISAVLTAVGWTQIKKRQKKSHRKTMTAAAVFAVIFFAIYSSRTVFIGNTSFGGPEDVKLFYTIFLFFHIALATIGAVLGIISLWTGFKERFAVHRRLGPFTTVVWLGSGITGVAVYLLLYVLYEGGETTSLIKAILGH
jgi:putative membrane protein